MLVFRVEEPASGGGGGLAMMQESAEKEALSQAGAILEAVGLGCSSCLPSTNRSFRRVKAGSMFVIIRDCNIQEDT